MLSAGFVTVRLSHETLTIAGTDLSDTILVDETPAGTVEVRASTSEVGPAIMPSTPLATFPAPSVRNIRISTLRGDDIVLVGSSTTRTIPTPGASLAFAPTLSIAGKLQVVAGQGNDTILVNQVSVGKDVSLSAGSGFDLLAINASAIGKDLEVMADSGNDILTAAGNVIAGEIEMETGHGDDFVTLMGDTVADEADISTGAGSDQLNVILSTADIVFATENLATYLATSVNTAGFANFTMALGATPVDALFSDELTGIRALLPAGGASLAAREAEFDMDSGVDLALIDDVNIFRDLSVSMDAGNDVLTFGSADSTAGLGNRFAKAQLSGNSGADTLISAPSVRGNGKVAHLRIEDFEVFLASQAQTAIAAKSLATADKPSNLATATGPSQQTVSTVDVLGMAGPGEVTIGTGGLTVQAVGIDADGETALTTVTLAPGVYSVVFISARSPGESKGDATLLAAIRASDTQVPAAVATSTAVKTSVPAEVRAASLKASASAAFEGPLYKPWSHFVDWASTVASSAWNRATSALQQTRGWQLASTAGRWLRSLAGSTVDTAQLWYRRLQGLAGIVTSELSVTPATLDFGTIQLDTPVESRTKSITVTKTNPDANPMDLRFSVKLKNITNGNDANGAIAVTQSATDPGTLYVTVDSRMWDGNYEGTITITDEGRATKPVVQVPVKFAIGSAAREWSGADDRNVDNKASADLKVDGTVIIEYLTGPVTGILTLKVDPGQPHGVGDSWNGSGSSIIGSLHFNGKEYTPQWFWVDYINASTLRVHVLDMTPIGPGDLVFTLYKS